MTDFFEQLDALDDEIIRFASRKTVPAFLPDPKDRVDDLNVKKGKRKQAVGAVKKTLGHLGRANQWDWSKDKHADWREYEFPMPSGRSGELTLPPRRDQPGMLATSDPGSLEGEPVRERPVTRSTAARLLMALRKRKSPVERTP